MPRHRPANARPLRSYPPSGRDRAEGEGKVSGTDIGLRGLTPIWLFALALVLGVFITVFAPIVASPDHVKLSDWFGFAGSLVGAMVTLGAAALAWRAVQGQIKQAENAIEAVRAKEEFASR